MRSVLILLLLSSGTVRAADIYSIQAADGTRILTNIGAQRAGLPPPVSTPVPAPPGQNYRSLVTRYGETYGIDPELVMAIMRVESNFNPRAVSPKNCKGLMQLHPDTALRFGVRDVFDPEQNIEGGIKYLQFLMNHFDRNLEYVLAAYNAGENAVKRHHGIPPYSETKDYVKKVSSLFQPETEAPAPRSSNRKIYRVVQSDGKILFTNTPSEAVQ